MNHDRQKLCPSNRTHINVNDPQELRYWCERFGVSQQRLTSMVARVGVLAFKVALELLHSDTTASATSVKDHVSHGSLPPLSGAGDPLTINEERGPPISSI